MLHIEASTGTYISPNKRSAYNVKETAFRQDSNSDTSTASPRKQKL